MINQTSSQIQIQSNYLWFLTLSYSMIMVFVNWFDARLIQLFSIVTDAGTFIFPLTFLLSDLITEVYGYKYARRAIWLGFFFNLFFLAYGWIITHLPSPEFATNNYLFDQMISINVRILSASIVSYLIAEPFNAFLLAKLKIKMHGRYMGFRFVASTILAAVVDSMIFSTIAFYGTMTFVHLLSLMLSMWFIKTFIEIIGLPFSIFFANKLKKIEQIDMFDNQTNFNIFSLDTSYPLKNNKLH